MATAAGPGSGGVPNVCADERRPRGLSPGSTLLEFGRVCGSCPARTAGKRDNRFFLRGENNALIFLGTRVAPFVCFVVFLKPCETRNVVRVATCFGASGFRGV